MTVTELEQDYLSVRRWLQRCVLPSALTLTALLLFFRRDGQSPDNLGHEAVILGFFALYFILVRGGHLWMIRSLHNELKRVHGKAYRAQLSRIDRAGFKRRNIGFTLARIKREILKAPSRLE